MDIREVVRIKKGTGGLKPPMNLGILLNREKRGKDHLAVVFTLRGELTVKWKSVKEGRGVIYPGDKKDEEGMRRFLKRSMEQERDGLVLQLEPDNIQETLRPEDLWNSIRKAIDDGKIFEADLENDEEYLENFSLSPEDIGSIHFYPRILDPRQTWAISRVLSDCDDENRPFFKRVDVERKPRYIPFTEGGIGNIRDHITRLEHLRSAYIETFEEEGDDGRTYKRYRAVNEDPNQAVLDGIQKRELDLICKWSMDFLENGDWSGSGDRPFGLGGTRARYFRKFSLAEAVADLSRYMIGARRKHVPSNLVGMLLALNVIKKREASELVVKFNLGSGSRKFHKDFPRHVLGSASSLPDGVSDDEMKGRRDLRNLETYTIDPPDAKDFDDAVSIEKNEQGWSVWIHIADVSHYVKDGDLIDNEARYRGTSVYLPTGVIPMLPKELSEDLCSLTDREDRLAVTTRLQLSEDLRVIFHEHMDSVIRVNKNLSYGQVDQWIDEGREPFRSLHEVSMGLSGSIERLSLETPERRVRFNDDDIEISIKRPTKATKLVEQLMVATNEAAASTIAENGLPLPYRVHPLPDSVSIEKFNGICRALELDVGIEMEGEGANYSSSGSGSKDENSMMEALLSGGKLTMGNFPFTGDKNEEETEGSDAEIEVPVEEIADAVSSYNKTLSSIDGIEREELRDMMRIWMLRTMPRAFYSASNIGHFGLGSPCYCHFTSPIRRYPDILAHRALKTILKGEDHKSVRDEQEMNDLLDHVNEMSDEAEEWEREMIDVALCTMAFLDDDIKKGTHNAILSSITPSTIFLSFKNGMMEGRAPLKVLSPYRLHVDENEASVLLSAEGNRELYSEEGPLMEMLEKGIEEKVMLRLGDNMRCGIHSISIAEGRIDLFLADPL